MRGGRYPLVGANAFFSGCLRGHGNCPWAWMRQGVIFSCFSWRRHRKGVLSNCSSIANTIKGIGEFIDESVCLSVAIQVTGLSCRIPLATVHGRKGKKKRCVSDKRLKLVGMMTTTNDPVLDFSVRWAAS